MLAAAGWAVVPRSEYMDVPHAQAVTEALTKGNNEADYLLFLDGKAIGVLEAKRAENSLGGKVAEQVAKYSAGALPWYQTWAKPLPFLFMSNGETLQFCDQRNFAAGEQQKYVDLKKMLTPKELATLAELKSEFAKMPAVPAVQTKTKAGLRQCQYDAICNLELSFKHGKKKALIVLATGAGKTFTACTAAYRLLNYTPAKKVLFLVDRNNLGKQAEGEFGTYKLTETGIPFSDEYVVQRLHNVKDIEKSHVVISTIQRLYAVLTGQTYVDTDDDESELDDATNDLASASVELPKDLKVARDAFDLIIVDECHRSIYGIWKQVLDYFNTARIVGLTATPTEEAYAFFNKNTVVEYTLENSILDGVNVPQRVFRINTQVGSQGGTIGRGERVERVTLLNGSKQKKIQKEDQKYEKTELDRSVVNPAQIRLVVDSFKQAIYSSLYPERLSDDPARNWKYIPKTLFFAKTDSHADNIVEAIKQSFAVEFEKIGLKLPEKFVQKITCKAGNSNQLISDFRNEKEFRIAVTVTLVVTGTDVKPLEILVFMRDINSAVLYTQMKGRGCRTMDDDKFQLVTPNGTSKDCFYLVDAVGVTEHEMKPPGVTSSAEFHKTLGLERLMERLAHGEVPDEHLNLFAGYLSKINNKAEQEDLSEVNKLLAPTSLYFFVSRIYDALTGKNEFSTHPLPEYKDINDANIERRELISAVINNVKVRKVLLEINRGFIKVQQEGTDTLIYAGFSIDESKKYAEIFKDFIEQNRDEVEALRIIYNSEDVAITYEMLSDLKRKLEKFNPMLNVKNLWTCYKTLSVNKVGKARKVKDLEKDEVGLLTNLIQLVRYALGQKESLYSLQSTSASLFELYCGQNQRVLNEDQKQVLKRIAQYVVQNGCVSAPILMQYEKPLFLQAAKLFGPQNVNTEIQNLTKFMFQ
jgi:type I restriction enzyme R subunit